MWKQINRIRTKSTIPLIDIHGPVSTKMTTSIIKKLNLINPHQAKALAVSVNSQGGLPVQAQIIARKIKNFADYHSLPLFTFANDYATSAGYYILCIGDEVYADRLSLVGSIGVSISKLNLKGFLQMGGIGVRQINSSQNEVSYLGTMSPLVEMPDHARECLQTICSQIHDKFKNHVRSYRKQKLKEGIMTGEVFSGEEGWEKGLVDGCGSYVKILAAKYPQAKIEVIKEKESWARWIWD